MAYASNIHVAVYQVLDQAMRASVPPPGAKAIIHSIIDDLRAASAPQQMIAQAESISLQLHHLEWAAARHDQESATGARENLRSIAATWLDHRITS
jgi:hypothetical protein